MLKQDNPSEKVIPESSQTKEQHKTNLLNEVRKLQKKFKTFITDEELNRPVYEKLSTSGKKAFVLHTNIEKFKYLLSYMIKSHC